MQSFVSSNFVSFLALTKCHNSGIPYKKKFSYLKLWQKRRRRRNYHMYSIHVVKYYACQFHFPITTETIITGMWSSSPLLRCQIVHLVDRSDLFKIGNLVCNVRETVRSLYCSLQGQTDSLWWV